VEDTGTQACGAGGLRGGGHCSEKGLGRVQGRKKKKVGKKGGGAKKATALAAKKSCTGPLDRRSFQKKYGYPVLKWVKGKLGFPTRK